MSRLAGRHGTGGASQGGGGHDGASPWRARPLRARHVRRARPPPRPFLNDTYLYISVLLSLIPLGILALSQAASEGVARAGELLSSASNETSEVARGVFFERVDTALSDARTLSRARNTHAVGAGRTRLSSEHALDRVPRIGETLYGNSRETFDARVVPQTTRRECRYQSSGAGHAHALRRRREGDGDLLHRARLEDRQRRHDRDRETRPSAIKRRISLSQESPARESARERENISN